MNEIKNVKFRLKSEMPKLSTDAVQEFEDAFWRLVDMYGIPEACNKTLSIVEDLLDEIMNHE